MNIAIVVAILLLFVAALITVVIWSIKRKGWLVTVRAALIGLIVADVMYGRAETTRIYLVPLAGALALTWLLPLVVRQRAIEREGEPKP